MLCFDIKKTTEHPPYGDDAERPCPTPAESGETIKERYIEQTPHQVVDVISS